MLVLLALLELALQATGSLVQSLMARREGPPDPEAPLSMVCVGDSNTYGLQVPRLYAYPSQLAARLDRRYDRPVSVLNRGVPGQNGAQVLRALRADLAHSDADLVLVLVGINDTWNRSAESGGLSALLARSRLVRLARVLTAGITTSGRFDVSSNDAGEIQVDRGDGPVQVNVTKTTGAVLDGNALTQRVRTSLTRIIDVCMDHGAVPVLMTYPEFQGHYAVVNAAIRSVAGERSILLVDHERAFQPHFDRDGYETLMFNDHHPNLRGYQLMASFIESALAEAGRVPPLRTDPASNRRSQDPLSQPGIELLSDGRLELTGPAGWSWQLLVGRLATIPNGLPAGDLLIPLKDDDVLALSRLEPSFSGQFEVEMPVTLSVPARLLAAADGQQLNACLLLLRDVVIGDSPAVSPISGMQCVRLPAP